MIERSDQAPVATFKHRFVVEHDVLDQNGHVNNVVYVKWMQDVAVRHSVSCGGTRAMEAVGGSWVVRSHWIEYLKPAFAGDDLEVITWVINFRRVRSMRRYRFFRQADQTLIARGETEWVFVDAASGRPKAIPQTVSDAFGELSGDFEP